MRNLTVDVREVNDRVVFLRKLIPGGASRSYGIEVAKLAGLPPGVVARAREILRNLESAEVDEGGHAVIARGRKARFSTLTANVDASRSRAFRGRFPGRRRSLSSTSSPRSCVRATST